MAAGANSAGAGSAGAATTDLTCCAAASCCGGSTGQRRIVVAAGDGAAFAVGSEVIGHVRSGAHASYLTVSDAALVRKPKACKA